LARCRCRDAPCDGCGGVLRHARRDHLRADLLTAVLRIDSRPGRAPRGARGRTRRRACAAGAGEPLMKTLLKIAALSAALALAGCASVGPNYHAAKIAAPQLQGLDAAQENNAQF